MAPSTNPPYRLSNWAQLVTRRGLMPSGSSGSSTGDRAVNPTKAATAVPTPSMGLDPRSTSSTYTPGDRYVGMCPPFLLAPHRLGEEAWGQLRLVRLAVMERRIDPHPRFFRGAGDDLDGGEVRGDGGG